MSEYRPRVVDAEMQQALQRAGAVLIQGPRACGKTETALQFAASEIHLDRDPASQQVAAVDPGLLLQGEVPRLLDEWQLVPALWNAVRGEVDSRKVPGQFILTGSTAPATDADRHTGAGRFARLRMRTMTHYELGWSTGEVSLASLLEGKAPRAVDPGVNFSLLTERIVLGGWPGFEGLPAEAVSANLADYLDTVATTDLEAADGVSRDPLRVRRLISALARSTASEVSLATLARDETSLAVDTVRNYLAALERIFVTEDQPAWSVHLRSSATLRKEPKRHFVDPSLAAAALNAGASALQGNPAFTGQLFESLAVQHLRVFSQVMRGIVVHARDSAGREVDAIIQMPGGEWAAFEVKLGVAPEVIDAAASNLQRFAAQVKDPPMSLTVLTSAGPSYRRPDGVNVVAFGALAP